MTNTTLRVLSYNIYWGGHQQPLERTIEVIRESGADLVGIQENVNREYEDQTPEIAKALGFSYVRHAVLDALEEFGAKGNKLRARWTQQAGQSTLSRHPITAQSPGGSGITGGIAFRRESLDVQHTPLALSLCTVSVVKCGLFRRGSDRSECSGCRGAGDSFSTNWS